MENNELENHLNNDKIISNSIWKSFKDAYEYDNVVSVTWLQKKLLILRNRIIKGEEVKIENENFVLNKETFEVIIKKYFPELPTDIINNS